jgi:hypothetical protein
MKKALGVLVLLSSIIFFMQNQTSFAGHDDMRRSRGGAWSSDGVYTGTPTEEDEIRQKFFKKKPIEIPPYKSDEEEKEDSEDTESDSSVDQSPTDDND